MTNKESDIVLSVEQARRELCISRGLIYQAIRNGEIPSIRIGRRILIPRAALQLKLSGGAFPNQEKDRGV